jgi:hypothetical protein
MENEFIKINHCPIRLDSIVGVSAPFWIDVDVKTKKKATTAKNVLGLKKGKSRRAYAFDVMTTDASFRIIPSDKPLCSSSNTKHKCLIEFNRVSNLLLNLTNEEKDNKPNTGPL